MCMCIYLYTHIYMNVESLRSFEGCTDVLRSNALRSPVLSSSPSSTVVVCDMFAFKSN